jgi:hypothetical protein
LDDSADPRSSPTQFSHFSMTEPRTLPARYSRSMADSAWAVSAISFDNGCSGGETAAASKET